EDRERDAGEDDLEEIAGRARDGGEEAEGGLPDREERAGGREEAVRSDERVPVAEREAEADRPVDERADAEDQDVLAGDVRGVLHAREAGLEEGEARLHDHHEDRRHHNPDRVRGYEQVRGFHRASTSSSRSLPVRLCRTLSTEHVQTSPSPDSLPLRAESTIA